MRKFLLAGLGVLFLLASAEGALAACTGPAVMHDFPGTSFNMALGQDPSGGCASNVNVLQNGALNVTGNPFYFLFGTGATLPAFASTPTVNLGTLNGAALAANQPTNATQASTTSGQTGNLVQCAATTSAPTYTTGTTNPINCDLAGNQRVLVTNTNANGPAAASGASPVTPSNQPIGAANLAATQVSVGSTATSILSARTGVAGTGRVSATITNTTTTAIYLGGSGVTTSTGTLLPGVVGASVTINTTAAIYGIVATGTATVTAFETY